MNNGYLPIVCALIGLGFSAQAAANCIQPPPDHTCIRMIETGNDPDVDAVCPAGTSDAEFSFTEYTVPTGKVTQVQDALNDGREVWVELEIYGNLSVSSSNDEVAEGEYEIVLYKDGVTVTDTIGQSHTLTSNTIEPQSVSLYRQTCRNIPADADADDLLLTIDLDVSVECLNPLPIPGNANAYLQSLIPPDICIEN